MPIRIGSQNEMNMARERVFRGTKHQRGFCYICGKKMPAPGPGARLSKLRVREHVIPRSLLGPSSDVREPWPVLLWVHSQCEERRKRGLDAAIGAIQRLHLISPESWPREDVREIGHLLKEGIANEWGQQVPAFDAKRLLEAAWLWVRGMHASLYGTFLPERTRAALFAPFPGFDSNSTVPIEEQLRSERVRSTVVMAAVHSAIVTDTWDGISAWGNQLRYRCIWYRVTSGRQRRGVSTMCLWTLTFPGVLEVAATVQEPTPWRGQYQYHKVPAGAAMLTQAILDAGNERRAQEARQV